jgi:hypothetical protein
VADVAAAGSAIKDAFKEVNGEARLGNGAWKNMAEPIFLYVLMRAI